MADAYLEDVPPVLSLVVQPFIQHFHYLHEIVSEKLEISTKAAFRW